MWVFLIWDLIAGEGYLTRDRFGVKPVYYATEADQVSICSEIDALARWTGLYKSENDHFLRSIVAGDTRVYGTAETHVREVSSLPAGHVARIHLDGTVEVSRWYTLRRLEVPRKLTDQAALMRQMLSDACSLRLRSDVPVATCLSGGIDSSAIVSTLQLLRRQGRDSGAFTYRSFTAAFPGTELDETRLASVIADINQVSLDEYIVECPTPEQL